MAARCQGRDVIDADLKASQTIGNVSRKLRSRLM
jgi:hypothetical protein